MMNSRHPAQMPEEASTPSLPLTTVLMAEVFRAEDFRVPSRTCSIRDILRMK